MALIRMKQSKMHCTQVESGEGCDLLLPSFFIERPNHRRLNPSLDFWRSKDA